MIRTFGYGLFALLMLLAAVSTATAQTPEATPSLSPQLPVTVQDATGADVTITDVSRIIPLNGNVAETIFALGLGAKVVATDVSALYPPEVLDLPKIGYQRELSAEGVLSLEPTLVIGTEEAGPPDVLDQIRGAGVPVLIVTLDESAEGAIAQIREVGSALGVPETANAIADNVANTITEAQALSANVQEPARVAFLYVRGQGTQLISGLGTLADAVITAAGGVNVGAEIGIYGYQPITPEALVTTAPDILLVLKLGIDSVGGIDGLLQIPGVAQTPAAQAGRVIAFDDLYLLGFGPRIGDAIWDLTLALYPEIDAEPKHPEWQYHDDQI